VVAVKTTESGIKTEILQNGTNKNDIVNDAKTDLMNFTANSTK